MITSLLCSGGAARILADAFLQETSFVIVRHCHYDTGSLESYQANVSVLKGVQPPIRPEK